MCRHDGATLAFAIVACQATLFVACTCFALPSAKENWVRIRSRHFDIVGNTHPDVAEDVAVRLERFRAFMEMGKAPHTFDPRITVFLFKDEESFAPYKKSSSGTVLNLAGVFHDTPYGLYIGMRGDLEDETFRIVYHEYTHFYLSRKPVTIPLWYHEGMAEYLSTFKTKGKKAVLGEPIQFHLETLRHMPWLALGDLFAADIFSPDYNEAERQSVFYAQSWGFLHYVRHARPELYGKITALVVALNAGESAMDAFQHAFGIDYKTFVNGMHEYFHSGRPMYIEADLSHLDVDESVQAEKLQYSDVLFLLGTYLADTAPWESRAAEEHLLRALESNPDHAGAHATLGTVLSQQGRLVDAREQFSRALDLAHDTDTAMFRYGMSSLQPYMTNHPLVDGLPSELPPELQEARQLLAMSLEQNPSRLDAYVACGWTYTFPSEDAAEGARLLLFAHDWMPNRIDVVYYLISLYLRLGQREKAEGLFFQAPFEKGQIPWYLASLRALGRSTTGHTTGSNSGLSIDQLLLALDPSRLVGIEANWERFRVAQKAYATADYDSCLSILDDLSRKAIDEALQDQVEILQPMAKRKQDELRQARMYNDAAEKTRARKYKEAAAILEKLLREPIRDPALEKTARDLLSRLQR